MRGEELPLLGGEWLDRVAHRRIVAAASAGLADSRRFGPSTLLGTRRHQPGRRGHQLDRVAAGGDRLGAGRAPVLAAALDLEAGVRAARRRPPRSPAATTATWPCGGHGRRLGGQQVDLGAAAFEPGELGERRRRLDPLEAEQLPEELDRALDVRRARPRSRRGAASIQDRHAQNSERGEGGGDDDRGRPGDRLGGDLHVEAVGVGDDHRVDARGHRREQQVGGRAGRSAAPRAAISRAGATASRAADRERDRPGQRRRHRQLAVLGVLGQGRADGEEAERQDRDQQRLREVDERPREPAPSGASRPAIAA